MDLKLNQNTYLALEKVKSIKGVSSLEYDLEGRKATVLDIGVTNQIKGKPSEKLGLLIADASMGLLGKTRIDEGTLTVEISRDPVIATLGCQLAGWAIEIGGKKLTIEAGRVAKQASGAVLISVDDNVVLCTVVAKDEPNPGQDFFPLSVDY